MSKSETNVYNDSVLRMLAVEQKRAGLYYTRSGRCPAPALIRMLAAAPADLEKTQIRKMDRHIRKCNFCSSLLQYLKESAALMEDCGNLPDVPKKLSSWARKMTAHPPPRRPSLFLRLEKKQILLIKNNLHPDGKEREVAETLNSATGRMKFVHYKNKFRFSIEVEHGKQITILISGDSKDGEKFPGVYVLMDENDNVVPGEVSNQQAAFHGLKPGTYRLTILLPSSRGVAELESILLVLLVH